MSEGFERIKVEGDGNQPIGSMYGGLAVNRVEGNIIQQAAARTTSPFQLPYSPSDFTGRQAELNQIYAALKEAGASGTVVISAVAGMAGVGKSALAIYAAHQLAASFPDARLYVNLQGADARPSDPNDVLGDWLRALGMEGAEIPPTLAARQTCYRSRLANKRALVLLDNAHDEAQVKPLLPGASGCAVIVTSRKKLSALAGAQPIDLPTLHPQEALKLLTKLAGAKRVEQEPAAAEEIVRLCGYLPLAVRIAGGVLNGKPHWALEADYLPKLADERQRIDTLRQEQGEDVRASFNLSYQQLNEAQQRLFGLLGTLTGDFGLSLAAYMGELTAEETKEIVERLIDA